MFHAAKDALAGRAARVWVNKLLARYGTVQHLKIDSRRRTMEISCLLTGESASITINVENYVVEADQGKRFLRATAFHCARPWLQNLLTDFGHQQRFELPVWAAAVLSPSKL